MVIGYTQLNSDDDNSPTKENTSAFPPTAPPLYTSLGYNNAFPGANQQQPQQQPLYPYLNAFPGAPQPLYPTVPQVPQPINGLNWFNPFTPQTVNPPNIITGQPEPAPQSEVIGNSTTAGNTAPQIINYQITYYAPQELENIHTEFINCCEDCCEDCCENWCLNVCMDCSKLTNSLFGANNSNAATTADIGYTPLSNGSIPVAPSSTKLVWDNGFTSTPLMSGSPSIPLPQSNGSTPLTLGNGFSPLVKKL